MEICQQVYGEHSLLTSRLYINIGIVHEDNNDYVKAFEYFRKWASVSEIVLGPDHPKTLRAKGVLKEPRYRLVALRLKEQEDRQGENEANEENNGLEESQINEEVEEMEENTTQHVGLSDDEENADEEIDGDEEEETDEGNFNLASNILGGLGASEVADVPENLLQMTAELQHAINELLTRALGEEMDNQLSEHFHRDNNQGSH